MEWRDLEKKYSVMLLLCGTFKEPLELFKIYG
jgi:hypothetical protein